MAMLVVTGCGEGSSNPTAVPNVPTTNPIFLTPTLTPVPPIPTEVPMPANMQWDAPPPMTIDVEKRYFATLNTDQGEIKMELFPKNAPETVNNFVFLAREGFYDNVTFHRVIPGFMAQGGDPTGTGAGGPGYQFADEFSNLTHVQGAVSMANAGPATNGSQFFIVYEPQHHLDNRHSVFGRVDPLGMKVVEKLRARDPQGNPPPGEKILSITIEEQERES